MSLSGSSYSYPVRKHFFSSPGPAAWNDCPQRAGTTNELGNKDEAADAWERIVERKGKESSQTDRHMSAVNWGICTYAIREQNLTSEGGEIGS